MDLKGTDVGETRAIRPSMLMVHQSRYDHPPSTA